MVCRKDICGFICILITYTAVFYADYVVTFHMILGSLAERFVIINIICYMPLFILCFVTLPLPDPSIQTIYPSIISLASNYFSVMALSYYGYLLLIAALLLPYNSCDPSSVYIEFSTKWWLGRKFNDFNWKPKSVMFQFAAVSGYKQRSKVITMEQDNIKCSRSCVL